MVTFQTRPKLVVPSSKSGSSFHNSPVKILKIKEEIDIVKRPSGEKEKGGWVEAVKIPVPSWGNVVQKINARPDSSESNDSKKITSLAQKTLSSKSHTRL
jgi:hypothetical protein